MSELRPRIYEKVQKHGMRIVRLEYSYGCNFHCQHCSIRDLQKVRDRRSMTLADVGNVAEQADELGFGQFVISGGEPLVYKDFDKIVETIDPQRFYITTDSNGWYLDNKMAKHLKSIGVDKVQISIDSINAAEHDNLRNAVGSWMFAVSAVQASLSAGLRVIVQTVVDKQRARSDELVRFIEHFNSWDVPVYIGYAKPVGAWKDHDLIDQNDIGYVEALTKKHNAFTHLTPAYNYAGGCIAMRRMINITKWGDVNPCPFMQSLSLGNVFEEPLKNIVERGEERFKEQASTCIVATDKDFLKHV